MTATVKKGGELFQHELEALFHENRQLIYKAAYAITASREDAEDVLQTVFLKLIQGKVSGDFGKTPQAYLYRWATNAATDVVRARERWKPDDSVDFLEIPVPAPEPNRDDERRRLRVAIARLKPEFVETLHLRYKEERSCRDIARIRHRPLGTVLSDLFRARAELKKLIRIEEKNSEKQEKHAADRRPGFANGSQA